MHVYLSHLGKSSVPSNNAIKQELTRGMSAVRRFNAQLSSKELNRALCSNETKGWRTFRSGWKSASALRGKSLITSYIKMAARKHFFNSTRKHLCKFVILVHQFPFVHLEKAGFLQLTLTSANGKYTFYRCELCFVQNPVLLTLAHLNQGYFTEMAKLYGS